MLFSATLDHAVDVLVRRFLDHPAEHAVDPPGAPAPIIHHLLTATPADPPAEHKDYLHRSGRTGRADAGGVAVTLHTPAQAGDVRHLMRKACVVPLAATVRPGSALLRSIAGKPAQPPAPQPHPAAAAQETAATATLATGRGAAAASASYRGRRRR
jgi:superfamily II DNA/RNA helicase